MANYFHIGEAITEVMNRKSFTKKELGEKLGMTDVNIYKILKKKSLNTDLVFKIASALNCPIGEFFGLGISAEEKEINKLEKKNNELEELLDQVANDISAVFTITKGQSIMTYSLNLILKLTFDEIKRLGADNENLKRLEERLEPLSKSSFLPIETDFFEGIAKVLKRLEDKKEKPT
jgi:transcriptional regulator with XRE-family HTH domain